MRSVARSSFAVPVFVAVIVVLLSAAAALDPAARGGLFTEAIAYLALGELVLAASLAATGATYRRCFTAATVAAVLCAPALAAGWEVGATGSDLTGAVTAVLAAVVTGTALGRLGSLLGLAAFPTAVASVSIGILLLWPATLGWFDAGPTRFPRPESSPVLLVGSLAVALALPAVLRFRGRPRRGTA